MLSINKLFIFKVLYIGNLVIFLITIFKFLVVFTDTNVELSFVDLFHKRNYHDTCEEFAKAFLYLLKFNVVILGLYFIKLNKSFDILENEESDISKQFKEYNMFGRSIERISRLFFLLIFLFGISFFDEFSNLLETLFVKIINLPFDRYQAISSAPTELFYKDVDLGAVFENFPVLRNLLLFNLFVFVYALLIYDTIITFFWSICKRKVVKFKFILFHFLFPHFFNLIVWGGFSYILLTKHKFNISAIQLLGLFISFTILNILFILFALIPSLPHKIKEFVLNLLSTSQTNEYHRIQ